MSARMQCKDVPDVPVLMFLAGLGERGATWFIYDPLPENTVARAMPPDTPEKLVLAKMRGLISRGLASGCPCGCRGDFEITTKGAAFLAREITS